jgi:hypothetical protein
MRYTSAHLNRRQILTDEQRAFLRAVSDACPISHVLDDNRHYEEWMVDFVYRIAP